MKTLIHVYKPNTFGFADFLRAIYPLSELASKNGYTYKCVINLPIQELLEADKTIYPETEGKFTTDKEFKQLESILKTRNSTLVIESNYADWFRPLPKDVIQSYIQPTLEIKYGVLELLKTHNLRSKMFNVLHIRCSDHDFTYFTDKTSEIFKTTMKQLRTCYSIIRSKSKFPILILSSNPVVAEEIACLPGVIITHSTPCHTMHETNDKETLKQTLIEFYSMEHAHTIYYTHGLGFSGKVSGFSYWASQMFKAHYVNLVH